MKEFFSRILTALAGMLIFVGCLSGQAQQETQEKPTPIITRTVEVKHIPVYEIQRTLDPIAKASGTIVTADLRSKLLLFSGNPERVAELEALVRRLDIAPPVEKSIELTVYLLTAGEQSAAGQTIPNQLEPVMKQLRATFTYKNYQLLETIFMRNRSSEPCGTNGFLPGPADNPKERMYAFQYRQGYITHDERGDQIHLDGLSLSVPGGSMSTSVDLRPGQMVVIGKTNYQTGNTAMIAVLSAKVVE